MSQKKDRLVRIVVAGLGIGIIAWAMSEDATIAGGLGFGKTQILLVSVGVVSIITAMLPFRVLAGYLSVLGSIALALVIGEIALRALYSPRYFAPYQLHPDYIYELVPNARREYRHLAVNGGEAYVYRINSDGFRGDELADDTERLCRVVVYGDSFIHGEFSRLKDTFAERLERRLAESSSRQGEVINAGIAGYGPDQNLRRFTDQAETLNPDLVVAAIYAGNDYGDLISNKLYRIGESGQLEANPYKLSSSVQRAMSHSRQELLLRKVIRAAADNWRNSADSLRLDATPKEKVEQALTQHQDEYREYVEEGDNTVVSLTVDPYSADVSLLPQSPSAQYKVKLMSLVLAEYKAIADRHGIRLIGLVIPHPIDVSDGNHETGEVDRAIYPEYDSNRMSETIADVWRSLDVETLNLLPEFRRHGGTSLYLKGGDDHWNNAGQDLAAELLTTYLRNNNNPCK